MPFIYPRTVRFQDTDAAGVVYFANVLAMCHEAYEASLAASGINLKSFFSNPAVAIPIAHAGADFFRPMFCGDLLAIHLVPKQLTDHKFEIDYQIFATDQQVAKVMTKHVCIAPASRTKQPLPDDMIQWLRRWGEGADL
ncbi:MAG: acyl-CoA thioesterase [Oscillatoria princeps RMCB-10]|jgi:1,4-dihydroxy-2-naphthoyl-CoA hydrolase|nr:acyl-CoA thioesterase [Oscillatoria princeps RMCB-10]